MSGALCGCSECVNSTKDRLSIPKVINRIHTHTLRGPRIAITVRESVSVALEIFRAANANTVSYTSTV